MSMHPPRYLCVLVLLVLQQSAIAQATVGTVAGRLPDSSIELYAKDPPATATPWQLPKPGDPHYDAEQEALIKDPRSHVARIYERGIFVRYGTVTNTPNLGQLGLAEELHSEFVPNEKLPADAVELSANDHPVKSDYYEKKPKKRPANVPANCVLVRVFQGKVFYGWTYMAKEAVARLHQPENDRS